MAIYICVRTERPLNGAFHTGRPINYQRRYNDPDPVRRFRVGDRWIEDEDRFERNSSDLEGKREVWTMLLSVGLAS